ncbi:hypothetical protein J0910_17270 [Nocardiopsis sp. CNT-189]|uniref:hypothetical protein n=1 Tax=Nocardiopsis oceanisediminis TaxID=2816862 RepID=UPI003B359E77
MPQPDPRRRKAVTAAVLVPAALIAGAGLLFTAPSRLLPEAVGLVVAATVTAALVWWAVPGIRARRGGAALFLLGWGACVLGAGTGGAATGALDGDLLPGSGITWGTEEDFGWFAYAPGGGQEAGWDYGAAGAAEEDAPTDLRFMSATAFAEDHQRFPQGVESAWYLGWVPALAGVVAYRRSSDPADPAAPADPAGD